MKGKTRMAKVFRASYIRVRFIKKVPAMNKILLINAMLLLVLLGLLQWICCNQVAPVNYFQSEIFKIFGFTIPGPFFFLIASFVIPVVAIIWRKNFRISRLQMNSLLIVNPIMFFLIAFMSLPQVGHDWTFKDLLGPSIIADLHEATPGRGSLALSSLGFFLQCVTPSSRFDQPTQGSNTTGADR